MKYMSFKKLITSLLIIHVLLVSYSMKAQSLPVDPRNMIKTVTPINPDVNALGQYMMQPPNYSNGLPQQNIPLYELKEEGITYPISLFYNYSGFKVREDASSVGLGWGLTSGVIIRVVKHVPDEQDFLLKKFEDFGEEYTEEITKGSLVEYNYTNPYYYKDDFFHTSSYSLTENGLFYKLYDGQPDLYIITFGNYSGKFLWINNKAVFLQPSDLLIERDANTNAFIVTTPDAVKYLFSEAEKVITSPPNVTKPPVCANCDPYEYSETPYTSTWRLAEISNKSTGANVTFSYKKNITGYHSFASILTLVLAFENEMWSMRDSPSQLIDINNISENYFPTEINSNNFKIVFNTQSRLDGGDYRINKIQIFNKLNSNPIKTITFTQDYFGDISSTSKCWLKLKKLNIEGGGSNAEYKFNYIDEYSSYCGDKTQLSIDHWGYFNNVSNSSLIPVELKAYTENYGLVNNFVWAGRNPDFYSARMFSLETVIYPTRGYTKYSFESANGRGIRVKSLEDFDGEKSTFRYYNYDGYVSGENNSSGNPVFSVIYDVEEYETHQCCSEDQLPLPGKYITFSGYERTSLEFCGDNPYNPKVIELFGSPDGKGGRTEYNFIRLDGYTNEVIPVGSSQYTYNGTEAISSESKNYSLIPLNPIKYWRIPIMRNTGIPSGPCGIEQYSSFPYTCCPNEFYYDNNNDLKHYILGEFEGGEEYLTPVWPRLDEVVTINDQVESKKKYFYNQQDAITGLPKHTMPISEEITKSDGSKKSIYYYYPGDEDPDLTGNILGVPQMWNQSEPDYQHMINPVIKSKTFIDNVLTSRDINYFTFDNINKSILRTTYEVFPNGDNKSQIWNFTYDSNQKLVSIQKENDVPTSIVWGYNKYYPVIKVENSDYAYVIDAVDKSLKEINYVNGFADWDNFLLTSSLQTSPGWLNFNQKLRAKLNGKLVFSYSYDLITGLNSQINFNNLITTYNYDNFGRLIAIHDHNGNLLKEYKYNYQPLFLLSCNSYTFPSNGGTYDITINTSNDWTYTNTSSWLSVNKVNNEILRLSCSKNGIDNRTAIITVNSTNLTRTITVNQSALSPYLNVPSDSYTFNCIGNESHTFEVNSNISWTFSSPASWLTATRIGNGIQVVCQANTTINERTAIISVQGEYGYTANIHIIQSRNTPSIIVIPNSFEFDKMGGTQDFEVNANVNWSIYPSNPVATKVDNSTLRVTLPQNSSSAWTTVVTLTGDGATATLNVSQLGFEPAITFTPEWYYFDENGGTTTFSITSNIPWIVDSYPQWLGVNPDGNSLIVNCQYFVIDPENPVPWRDGLIILRGEGIYSGYSVEIPVNQEYSNY